jgi:hypothetical protein
MTTPVYEKKTDKIWYKDIPILFTPSRLIDFFPTKCNTLEENLNSIVRLSIYGSIIITLYKRDPRYMAWIIIFLLLTYVIDVNYDVKVENYHMFDDLKTKLKKPKPTINNPFMNPVYSGSAIAEGKPVVAVEQYYQDTEKAENTREDIKNKFNYNLYQDIEDVFERGNAQRQFYTVPSTTIPNDQELFSNFLFGDMKSCKENSSDCIPFRDLKRDPPVLANINKNPINN